MALFLSLILILLSTCALPGIIKQVFLTGEVIILLTSLKVCLVIQCNRKKSNVIPLFFSCILIKKFNRIKKFLTWFTSLKSTTITTNVKIFTTTTLCYSTSIAFIQIWYQISIKVSEFGFA